MTKSVDLEASRTSVMSMVVLDGAIVDMGATGGAVVATSVRTGVVGLWETFSLVTIQDITALPSPLGILQDRRTRKYNSGSHSATFERDLVNSRKVCGLSAGNLPYLAAVSRGNNIFEMVDQGFLVTRKMGDAFSDVEDYRSEPSA